MEIITARKAFLMYLKDAEFKTDGTKRQYTPKINNYTNKIAELNVTEALLSVNLMDFIVNDGSPQMALAALEHFYNYVHQSLLKNIQYDPFPINKDLLRKELRDEEDSEGLDPYLINFDFQELFDDRWYDHLNNKNITIALRACLAVCLGAAFDKGEIESLVLSDFDATNSLIKVRNPFQNYKCSWISFDKDLSFYISEYISVRQDFETDTDKFFIRVWDAKDTRSINYDSELWGVRKPSYFIAWVSYILKYISHNMNLNKRIYLTNLKDNTVYHYLLRTNGKGLNNLIRTYGWSNFIHSACSKYYAEESIEELETVFYTTDKNSAIISEDEAPDYFFQFPHQK